VCDFETPVKRAEKVIISRRESKKGNRKGASTREKGGGERAFIREKPLKNSREETRGTFTNITTKVKNQVGEWCGANGK